MVDYEKNIRENNGKEKKDDDKNEDVDKIT